MKLLELRDVSKIYKAGGLFSGTKVNAVTNVCLEIPGEDGKILSIVGESGSGKTTLARIILGLVVPTSGSVWIDGRNFSGKRARQDRSSLRRLVQPVSQNPFESFSARRRVDSYLYEAALRVRQAGSRSDARVMVDETLRFVGLEASYVRGKFRQQFSGGELQRISIARALICGPRLIIADEPVSMIDASQKMNIVNLFRDLRDRLGVSFVYITHDLSTADYVSDDIAIMYKGEIVEQGKPARLFSEPSHSYTRLLLASIATVDRKWTDDSDVAEEAPIACGSTPA